jgi:hypothetical protein
MADTPDLGTFEGKQVAGVALRIVKAGDGLSSAMEIEPLVLHNGDQVDLVVRGHVTGIAHVPFQKDDDRLLRVQTVTADVSTVVDGQLVEEVVVKQKARLQEHEDRKKGIEKIDTSDGPEPETITVGGDVVPLRPAPEFD